MTTVPVQSCTQTFMPSRVVISPSLPQVTMIATMKPQPTKRLAMSHSKRSPTKWPKTKRRVKVPDETAIELQEKLAWAEDLTQTVIVQMMHTLGENSIDISDNAFVRDMALIIEMTKGSIYRSMGIAHPTHGFSEALVEIDVDEDSDSMCSQVDFEVLEKYRYIVNFLRLFKIRPYGTAPSYDIM